MTRQKWIPLAAAALAVAVAPAQVPVGTQAPSFELKQVLNGELKSFKDLAGKVVLLDFSESW